ADERIKRSRGGLTSAKNRRPDYAGPAHDTVPLTPTQLASGVENNVLVHALDDVHAFTTWPRISPPLLASVWTLAYNMPFCRSSAWASVKVAWPLNGLERFWPFSEIQITGAAFLPTSAGPWKCAAVAGPLRPEKLPSQVRTLVPGS